MSFGFGISDFITLYTKLNHIYTCLRDAPDELTELADTLRDFRVTVDNIKSNTTTSFATWLRRTRQEDQARIEQLKVHLKLVSEHAGRTLDAVNAFILKYRINGRWQRLRSASCVGDIPKLRDRLVINYLAMLSFQSNLMAEMSSRLEDDIDLIKSIALALYMAYAVGAAPAPAPVNSSSSLIALSDIDTQAIRDRLRSQGVSTSYIDDLLRRITSNLAMVRTFVLSEADQRRARVQNATVSGNTPVQSTNTDLEPQPRIFKTVKPFKRPFRIIVEDQAQSCRSHCTFFPRI